jgi:hypothetical protein
VPCAASCAAKVTIAASRTVSIAVEVAISVAAPIAEMLPIKVTVSAAGPPVVVIQMHLDATVTKAKSHLCCRWCCHSDEGNRRQSEYNFFHEEISWPNARPVGGKDDPKKSLGGSNS